MFLIWLLCHPTVIWWLHEKHRIIDSRIHILIIKFYWRHCARGERELQSNISEEFWTIYLPLWQCSVWSGGYMVIFWYFLCLLKITFCTWMVKLYSSDALQWSPLGMRTWNLLYTQLYVLHEGLNLFCFHSDPLKDMEGWLGWLGW